MSDSTADDINSAADFPQLLFSSNDDKKTSNGQTEFSIEIRRVITELRSKIDQLNSNFEDAKYSILELARRFDEGGLCERNQICRRIKDILKDKIKQGHITEKWIEDCLPADYKRKYVKSEVSSVSKKAKKAQEITIDNSGKAIEETPSAGVARSTPFSSSLQDEQLENIGRYEDGGCPKCAEVIEKNSQLEEALRKATQISTADQLAESKIKINVPRDRYKEIKSAMQLSKDSFHIIFDSTTRSFVRAISDVVERVGP